ncbi:MAG: patatin-like phospholipase family protein [Deltaproteobacteria bacterium]|nr:patatin-like phospholipase family protein [Deltaproteobacteria bacterium]
MREINLIHLGTKALERARIHSQSILLHTSQNKSGKNEFYVSECSLSNLKKHRIKFNIISSWSEQEFPITLIYPPHAMFYEMPTESAINEALCYAISKLGKRKNAQLFFEGRHINRSYLPSSEYFYFDQPSGLRSYLWKFPKKWIKTQNIRTMFPKLTSLIKDPDARVILSLGSGGIRLYAHPTIMKFFDILELRAHIDEIWGCSGGAIAGLPYSMGVAPQLIEEEGYHLYNDRYSIRFSPNKLEVIKNILIDHFVPNSDHMLKGFADCQDVLRKAFEKHVSIDINSQKRIPFFGLAYNIRAQRLEILTPEKINRPYSSIPIFHTEAMEAMIASSSVPILFIPKKIMRGKTEHIYVDGGTVEEIPLLSVFQKWKEDRRKKIEKRTKLVIISVNLFPHFSENSLFKHWLIRILPTSKVLHLFAKYTDMIRDARIADHMKYLKHHKKVQIIDINLPMKEGSVMDPMVVPTVIKTAQKTFFKQLLEYEKNLKI